MVGWIRLGGIEVKKSWTTEDVSIAAVPPTALAAIINIINLIIIIAQGDPFPRFATSLLAGAQGKTPTTSGPVSGHYPR